MEKIEAKVKGKGKKWRKRGEMKEKRGKVKLERKSGEN